MVTNEQKHQIFLYPVVRVFSEKAAGSGTIIYSKEDPDNPGDNLTFVLTNFHVVEDLIGIRKDWDSLLKRNIEKEFLKRPHIEVFSYVRTSYVDSSNRYNGDIVCYDRHQDLAILKIDSPRKFDYVADLIPKDKIKELRLFQEVVVSGCSLAHEPFCNFGQITFLNELIDQKKYIMSNANSIFGNSGGALFMKDTGWMIGVPSRITGIQIGFGYDVTAWMGFSAHPERLYEFFEQQEIKFIFDSTDTYKAAMERRKKKEMEALMAMKAEKEAVGHINGE